MNVPSVPCLLLAHVDELVAARTVRLGAGRTARVRKRLLVVVVVAEHKRGLIPLETLVPAARSTFSVSA